MLTKNIMQEGLGGGMFDHIIHPKIALEKREHFLHDLNNLNTEELAKELETFKDGSKEKKIIQIKIAESLLKGLKDSNTSEDLMAIYEKTSSAELKNLAIKKIIILLSPDTKLNDFLDILKLLKTNDGKEAMNFEEWALEKWDYLALNALSELKNQELGLTEDENVQKLTDIEAKSPAGSQSELIAVGKRSIYTLIKKLNSDYDNSKLGEDTEKDIFLKLRAVHQKLDEKNKEIEVALEKLSTIFSVKINELNQYIDDRTNSLEAKIQVVLTNK